MLLAGSASAETFSRVPDLAQLVSRPIRGEYVLLCSQYIAGAKGHGWREVQRPKVVLERFPSLELTTMVRPGLPTDKIATTVLVHLCVESDTDYVIDAGRAKPVPRDNVVTEKFGSGQRSAIQQVTR